MCNDHSNGDAIQVQQSQHQPITSTVIDTQQTNPPADSKTNGSTQNDGDQDVCMTSINYSS